MSFAEDQTGELTAIDFLALDEEDAAHYLDSHRNDDGECDASCLVGAGSLPESQQNELAERIRAVTSRLGMSTRLDINDLLTRLQKAADEQDGAMSPATKFERRAKIRWSAETTEPVSPNAREKTETAYYRELVEDGGRPVCSVQHLLHLRATPTASHEAVLPWLSDHPGSEKRKAEIETVFSRQVNRWWGFRKSQWHNRGIGDSEEEFSAYFKAYKGNREQTHWHRDTLRPTFDAQVRTHWQCMPKSRQLPEGQGFPAYRDAVKGRLAPHCFTRPLQLKKNPRQQNTWTNWLEYLSYEKWWSERLTAVAVSLAEEQYYQPRKRLCKAGEAMDPKRGWATLSLSDLGPFPVGTRFPVQSQSEVTKAELDETKKSINDFIRETERYTAAQTAAYYQSLRVEWAVKEAHLMETEMSQQRRTAKSDTQVDTKVNEKRRRGDDEGIPSEPWSKRIRPRNGDKSTVSGTTSGKPQPRRSSRQLAKLKKGKAPL